MSAPRATRNRHPSRRGGGKAPAPPDEPAALVLPRDTDTVEVRLGPRAVRRGPRPPRLPPPVR